MEFDSNLILKLISIPSLFFLCFIFGIIPYAIKKCRMNESFLSYANTFSAGLFFGIGQFHLLNEGVEKLSKYTKIPLAYFLAAGGYSLILFIQKVVFGYMVSNAEENLENYSMNTSMINREKLGNLLNESGTNYDSSPSLIKNEDLNNTNNSSDNSLPKIGGNENEDNINQNDISKVSKALNNFSEGLHLKKKKLSAFILLLSLSIHGLFECLALGIQTNYNDALLLFIALMIHKWAEAFALGILFVKAKFTKKFYYLIIFLFAFIGPVGVVVGIVLAATTSEFVEGIFLGVSTGTFLYVSCSEVIVEEFSTPERRYAKFFLYLVGCFFAAGLSLLEEFL